jgi:lysophospholipase L1-like esterase
MESVVDIKKIIKEDYEKKTHQWKQKVWSCDEILVGDSMVAYFLPSKPMCLMGIAGDTSLGVLNRIDTIKHAHASHILIHIGTNDIVLEDMEIEDTIDKLKEIKHALSESRVTFITPMPVIESNMSINNIKRTNHHLKALTTRILETFNENVMNMNEAFHDLNDLESYYKEDGLHLNKKGYTIYEEILKTYLKK